MRLLALQLAWCSAIATGQPTESATSSHRVSLVVGSLEVATGCVSVLTDGSVDAFFGRLEGPCPSIAFATGMVEVRPSRKTFREYANLTREKLAVGELVYGTRMISGARALEAAIGRATFAAPASSPAQIDEVLKVLRSFQSGQCQSCAQPIDRRPKRQYP